MLMDSQELKPYKVYVSEKLVKLIADKIKAKGPISFARFMDLALYHPKLGYYYRPDFQKNIGKEGDFITSVSIGGIFGKLLASQFYDWWKTSFPKSEKFSIVEFGAFNGALCFDVLKTIQSTYPDLLATLKYVIVEPSESVQSIQRQSLKEFTCVQWVSSVDQLDEVVGIVFSNELLDAMPVHLVERKSNQWIEHCVALDGDDFVWKVEQVNDFDLISNLPENYSGIIEVSPARNQWLLKVSSRLKAGFIVAIDYGYTDEEYFEVKRPKGTVRTYAGQRIGDEVLSCPGQKDITCHVRWTPLIEKSRELNLEIVEFIQQGRWLSRIFAGHPMELTPSEIRQFKSLTYPDSLGEPFRTLVLRRN